MPGGPAAKRAKKGGVTGVKMEHIPGQYVKYIMWITRCPDVFLYHCYLASELEA